MLRNTIAQVPLETLVEKFTTPFFVYDAASIRRRIGELKKFDTIRYAQKANSNIAILKLLREEGVLVDCVSSNEIRRALLAGYSSKTGEKNRAPQIVYTADLFDRESLDLVVEKGISVNCGSLDMISQLGERAPNRDITIRINPGFGHGHSRKTNTGGDQSKHGIWFEQIEECKKKAAAHNLRITGLHNHIGSGCDFEHLSKVCSVMREFALQFGPEITMLSTGGGLPIPYEPGDPSIDVQEYYKLWNKVRCDLQESFAHPIHLETEPGRYLLAESGFLVSEIRAVKTQGENLFYLVDAGFNDLIRPALYGAYHPISLFHKNGDFEHGQVEAIIGGPLCESGDIFTQQEGGFVVKRKLPKARVGDYLILEIAGAYGSVMSSNYNSKVYAEEILIENGIPRVIRKRQTFEQLVENEVL